MYATSIAHLRKEDILKSDYNDILFENRNRRYGAYYLRKKQRRFVLAGLLLSCGSMVLGLLMPYIIDFLFRSHSINNEDFINVRVDNVAMTKGQVTPYYIPPPPPPKKDINIPPKVVKDPVQDDPKKDLPKNTPESTGHDPKNKDSTQKSPGTGREDGDPNQIFLSFDQVPTLKTAEYKDINDYISKKTIYPEMEKMLKHQGRITVTATVNKDGTLENIHLHNHLSPGLDAEALRVIRSMPRLNPAMRKGKPARVFFMFPVDFHL
jgi:periplasmic protein TonB